MGNEDKDEDEYRDYVDTLKAGRTGEIIGSGVGPGIVPFLFSLIFLIGYGPNLLAWHPFHVGATLILTAAFMTGFGIKTIRTNKPWPYKKRVLAIQLGFGLFLLVIMFGITVAKMVG